MKIEKVKISQVKPNPDNPRVIQDADFDRLVKSIEDFPEMLEIRPIVVDNEGMVLGGNQRLKACKKAGLKEVFIIRASELTEEQREKFIIRDNGRWGAWDYDLLKDWNPEELELSGVELPELEVEMPEAKEVEAPEVRETDIVIGDLFEIGEHRLLCGDSTDSDVVEKLMNGEKADMVFTDPPYGVNYTGGVIHGNKINKNHKREMLKNDDIDLYADFISLLPLVIENGAIYIFYAIKNSYQIFKPLYENNIDIMAVLAWIKINTGYADMNSHYKNRYEPCVYAKMGKSAKWIGASNENTTWEIEKDRDNKLHPTQKPISVPSRAIGNHEADLIMDFFLGSGSTMVAAHQLQRKCYGMELDPVYCDVIVRRMLKTDPTLTIKRNGTDETDKWRNQSK